MKHLSNAEIMLMRSAAINAGAEEFWAMAQDVCDFFGVKVGDLKALTRGRDVVCACRALVCRMASDRGYSISQIARFLHRDRSSVLHAIESTVTNDAPVMFKSVRGAV